MPGGSKQTIGYKYFLGMHIDLCHGPIDKITRLEFDKRTAWCGESTGGRISVNAPKLFGGEKRQGGIVGEIDFLTGAPDQLANDYLEAQLGAPIPAFRGVAALVFRQVYLGMSEYLKPLSVRAQRVYVGTDGAAQWYPEKAGIPACSGCSANAAIYLALDISQSMATVVAGGGTRLSVAKEAVNGFLTYLEGLVENFDAELDVMIVAWGGAGDGSDSMYRETISKAAATVSDVADLKTWVAARTASLGTYFPAAVADAPAFFAGSARQDRISVFVTDGEPSAWNGSEWLAGTPANDAATAAGATLLGISGIKAYAINIALLNTAQTGKLDNTASDGVPVVADGDSEALEAVITAAVYSSQDMNPAHAIRECITDPAWAMSYPAADVDDVSFTAAADQLYSEGMGWGQVWDQQGEIGEYIDRITRHIDAELYIDRRTGKYTLQLIRDDYDADDPEQCPVLGVNEILAVENFGAPALGELKNSVTVRYWNCETGNVAAVTVHDQALALMQGGTIGETFDYLGFSKSEIATRVAFREQRALGTRRRSCTIYANRAARNLAPGKVFKMDYPDWTGSSPIVMRVVEIAFGNGKTKVIRIKCIEDVFSLGPAPIVGSMPTRWADPSTRPISATDRLVFEAPYWEFVRQAGQAQADLTLTYDDLAGFLMGTARRPGVAINAEMHADAGAGYEFGATVDFSPWGIVADAYPPAPGPTVVTLSDHEDLDEAEIGQLAYWGAELVRLDAIDFEADPVEVTLGRGCLDTVPASHAAGEKVVFWQDFAAHSNTQYASGETVNVKLLPSGGAGEVDIALAPADAVTFAQRAFRPLPPGDFKIDGVAYPETADFAPSAATSLTWAHRDRKLQTGGQLDDTTVGNIGPEAGTTYAVQLRNAADDSLLSEQTGISGASATIDTTGHGVAVLRFVLFSVRDGVESWQRHVWDVDLGLWEPLHHASTKFLLDDESEVTLSGSEVLAITDRTGLGRNFIKPSATYSGPSVVPTALNGRRVLDFSGNQYLGMGSPSENYDLYRNTGYAWIFAVYKVDTLDGANTQRPLLYATVAGDTTQNASRAALFASLFDVKNRPSVGGRRLDGDSFFRAQSSAEDSSAQWALLLGVLDYSARTITLYRDGQQATQTTSAWAASGNCSDTRSAFLRIGASGPNAPSTWFDGKLAAICSGTGASNKLSSGDIDKLFGWAAHRYALQGLLPGAHPYKTNPPLQG